MTEYSNRNSPGRSVDMGRPKASSTSPPPRSHATDRAGVEPVEALAGQVLSVIASRAPSAPDAADPDGEQDIITTRLIEAVQATSQSTRDHAVEQMIQDGVSIDDLIDRHIPQAARRMGAAWCSDGMSFADVTIGSARLQGLLRDLVRNAPRAPFSDPMAPQILMVVRQDNNHTLGAMVATQQLRRIGVDVRIALGQPDDDVFSLIAAREFDMIMLSCDGTERHDDLGRFVKGLRGSARYATPIVIGGCALMLDADFSKTGADFITANPEEALARFGLKSPRQGARLLAAVG